MYYLAVVGVRGGPPPPVMRGRPPPPGPHRQGPPPRMPPRGPMPPRMMRPRGRDTSEYHHFLSVFRHFFIRSNNYSWE